MCKLSHEGKTGAVERNFIYLEVMKIVRHHRIEVSLPPLLSFHNDHSSCRLNAPTLTLEHLANSRS